MKQFISKTILFLSLFFVIMIVILTWIDFKGYSDAYYKRFSSNKQTSLIIGTSRAAQALQPQIIDSVLSNNTQYALPIYNFAFTVSMSPFGEIYYNAIEKKIMPSNGNGLFIVAVDPFSICVDTLDEQWDADHLREEDYRLSKVHLFTKPCYEYLIQYCNPHQWINSQYEKLHDDGWLEITPPNMDSTSVAENIIRKMEDYNQRRISKSAYRLFWLEQTIQLLQQHGDVYLCRVPVSKEMQCLEDKLWGDFDLDMETLSNKYNVAYFSFSKEYNHYQTTDGNHLYKASGALFSKTVADTIKSVKTNACTSKFQNVRTERQ